MQSLGHVVRRSLSSLSSVLLSAVFTFVGRSLRAWRRHSAAGALRRHAERTVLPSIYDRHPDASRAPRRRVGLKIVPLDAIVGTMRHPSQNTADFLPLPRLRGENWRARWQRITRAMDRLVTLPPVDLVQVGDDYYVADGHNRVAAARHAGAVEIDADVTQLILPGVTRPGQATLDAGSLVGTEQVRMAAQGRHSRTVEQRGAEDRVSRRDLVRKDTTGPEDGA
ncbi:MAG TPA: hypothetical protein VM253_03505 [Candidatus Limnocylindrales bacterium]|jgi:hypothetical protein|nr:hypothetical protein [Candidatus Limnocylindrales bacterium]